MAFLRKYWAALAVAAMVALTVLVGRLAGRVWFCDCWQIRVWIASAWSEHTSQHLFDLYSLTHVEHGLILFWCLAWLTLRSAWHTRLVAATAIESAWEMVENSPFVINRYRDATAALGYAGDSVVNVAGDVLSCILGFAVAQRLGWRWTLALILAIEVGLLIAIRDNLFLNVVMLLLRWSGSKSGKWLLEVQERCSPQPTPPFRSFRIMRDLTPADSTSVNLENGQSCNYHQGITLTRKSR